MTEELIKFTPGQRPAHIGPMAKIQYRPTPETPWRPEHNARDLYWRAGCEYKFSDRRYIEDFSDGQLEAQCNARGMTVTKPLVTQAERDRLADAFEHWDSDDAYTIRCKLTDAQLVGVRAFIDTYEGKAS